MSSSPSRPGFSTSTLITVPVGAFSRTYLIHWIAVSGILPFHHINTNSLIDSFATCLTRHNKTYLKVPPPNPTPNPIKDRAKLIHSHLLKLGVIDNGPRPRALTANNVAQRRNPPPGPLNAMLQHHIVHQRLPNEPIIRRPTLRQHRHQQRIPLFVLLLLLRRRGVLRVGRLGLGLAGVLAQHFGGVGCVAAATA